MAGTWRWPIAVGSTKERRFRLRELAFGDGYAQRARDGINHRELSMQVTSELTDFEYREAEAFLEAHGGDQPIDFIDPDTGWPFKGIVRRYTTTYGRARNWRTLSMDVELVHTYP